MYQIFENEEQKEEDYTFEYYQVKKEPYLTKRDHKKNKFISYIHKKKLILKNNYELLDTLGGKVAYACLDKNIKRFVYLKYYHYRHLITERDYKIQMLKQIKCLKFFQHDNIVKALDINNVLPVHQIQQFYYATELMETDLQSIIRSQQILTDHHIKFFMYQILLALNYLHSLKIIYSDLKPFQILINSNCDIKLYQFKQARSFLDNKRDKEEYVCARFYRAPEIYYKDEFSSKSDIWSAGCIFAELHNRQVLFANNGIIDMLERQIRFCKSLSEEEKKLIGQEWILKIINKYQSIQRDKLSQKFIFANPLALDLMDKMLQFFPENRFDALQCLKHPYFEDLFHEDDLVIRQEEFDWTFLDKCIDMQDSQIDILLYKESLYFDV